MSVADFLSTKRERARAAQAKHILILADSTPLTKLTFGELSDLLAMEGSTGEGGLPDRRLATLENRLIEIKQEAGDIQANR